MNSDEVKKMLILRACGSTGENEECINIKAQAELYDIEVHDKCPKTNAELTQILSEGETFDYIYLATHGNENGFCNETRTIDFSWIDFGTHLCSAMCMNEECIILLSCCRGGLNQVAYSLFYCCQKIAYIVGARQSLYPYDLLIGFNILLYNLEYRGIDPIVACEKIKLGTDIRFVCFDRLETESEPAYWMYLQRINTETLKQVNQAKEKANESPAFVPPEITHQPKIQIVP